MNRPLTILLLVALTALCAALSGCDRSPTPTGSDSIIESATEPTTNTSLKTEVDRATILLADRIWVTTTWHWNDGVVVTLEDPDWDSADWSVIETVRTEPTRDEDGYWAQQRVLLEPFLPGKYVIPTGHLLIESTKIESPLELEIERELLINVEGVLPESDTGELNPVVNPAMPEREDENASTLLLVGVSVTVAIIACCVIVYLRYQQNSFSSNSVHDQLVMIRDRADLQEDRAFLLLEQAFNRLDPRLRGTKEFAGMIRACEQARYAPKADSQTSPSRLAAFTLELLGHDAQSHHSGGGRT